MSSYFSKLRLMSKKYMLFSVIYAASISLLTFIILDIFVFDGLSGQTFISGILVGAVVGIFNNKYLNLKKE